MLLHWREKGGRRGEGGEGEEGREEREKRGGRRVEGGEGREEREGRRGEIICNHISTVLCHCHSGKEKFLTCHL